MQSFYSTTYFASFIIISELWFYSYTDGERTMLLNYFERAYFYCDIQSVVRQRVLETVEKFYNGSRTYFTQLLQAWYMKC